MTIATRTLVALLAITAGTAGTASDAPTTQPGVSSLERYERLAYNMVDLDAHTDDQVVELVFKGIHSKDSRIVKLTVQGLFYMAFGASMNDYAPTNALGSRPVGRPLHKVPGLRDFLLELAQTDMEHGGAFASDLDVYADDDIPTRSYALLPLVAFFPGDAAVEKLLSHYDISSRDDRASTVVYLNSGRFTSVAADAERRRLLATSESDRQDDVLHEAFRIVGAAKGLAFSKTDAGLAALVEALDRGVAVAEIAEAIAAHGRRALPHRAHLRSVLREFDPERAKDPCAALVRQMNAGDGSRTAAACPSAHRRIKAVVAKLDALAGRYPPPGEAASAYVPAPNATLVAYEQLADDLDNPDVDDGTLADMVFEGVHSHDLRLVHSTVRALAENALTVNLPAVRADAPRRRTRALSAVPGLRGFLMEQAAEGIVESGFGAFAADRPNLGRLSTPLLSALPLAVYFAGDLAVHDFLLSHWRERRRPPRPRADAAASADLAGAVRLLNAGGFRTAAADRLRARLLASGEPRHVAWAARGLGRSQTDAGLAALAAALPRSVASGAVAEAIALHGKRAAPRPPARTGGAAGAAGPRRSRGGETRHRRGTVTVGIATTSSSGTVTTSWRSSADGHGRPSLCWGSCRRPPMPPQTRLERYARPRFRRVVQPVALEDGGCCKSACRDSGMSCSDA